MRYATRGEDDPFGSLDRSLMEGGTDLEAIFAHGIAAIGFYMTKRKMRKLGAPPWVAYAVAMIDWTLTGIGVQLMTRNRYLIARHYRNMGYDMADASPRRTRPMPASSSD